VDLRLGRLRPETRGIGGRNIGAQTIATDAPIGSPPLFAKDADRADLRAIS